MSAQPELQDAPARTAPARSWPGSLMWDGREPSLEQQAIDATRRPCAGSRSPTPAEVKQIVEFENAVSQRPAATGRAGRLDRAGAHGRAGASFRAGRSIRSSSATDARSTNTMPGRRRPARASRSSAVSASSIGGPSCSPASRRPQLGASVFPRDAPPATMSAMPGPAVRPPPKRDIGVGGTASGARRRAGAGGGHAGVPADSAGLTCRPTCSSAGAGRDGVFGLPAEAPFPQRPRRGTRLLRPIPGRRRQLARDGHGAFRRP